VDAEALDEVIGTRQADLGHAMLDVGERPVELIRVTLAAAKLAGVVGQNRTDREVEAGLERHGIVV
jgi:hypothetical protein